ncbi:MAG: hypothetical protein ABSF44_02565 [Candidatus Bathyarchaeia archaeon]|jgi:hypothetical protein
MKVQQTLHWNNFTVPELKDILEHCEALERLGIAQDEEMMCSIERDVAIREKKTDLSPYQLKASKIKQQNASSHTKRQQTQEYPLVLTI